MSWVLTLVAPQHAAPISNLVIARASDLLAQKPSAKEWLHRELAVDLFLPKAPDTGLVSQLGAFCGAEQLDYALQPLATRPKKLFLADMESTIIAEEILDELAAEQGLGAEIAAITKAAMEGRIGFEEALEKRVAMLAGLELASLHELRARLFLNPGAKTLVATLNKAGVTTVLVSGGFSYFTNHIRRLCGFLQDFGNTLEIADNRLSGKILGPILGRAGKAEILQKELARLGLPASASAAIGDGANDIDLVREAGLGIAYHGKATLRQAADCQIAHGDLTVALYFLGYSYESFCKPD